MCTTAQLDFFRIVLELCGYTEIFLDGGIKYNIYKFHTMGAFISIASFPTLGFITRSNAKLACDFDTRAKLCVCYDRLSNARRVTNPVLTLYLSSFLIPKEVLRTIYCLG